MKVDPNDTHTHTHHDSTTRRQQPVQSPPSPTCFQPKQSKYSHRCGLFLLCPLQTGFTLNPLILFRFVLSFSFVFSLSSLTTSKK